MHYQNGLLFTGWRDGFIRIFRLAEFVDDLQGKHITSDLVAQIDMCRTTATDRSAFHDITTLYNDGSNLYVGTQSGIFAVIGLDNIMPAMSRASGQNSGQASTTPINFDSKTVGFWCSLNEKVQVE